VVVDFELQLHSVFIVMYATLSKVTAFTVLVQGIRLSRWSFGTRRRSEAVSLLGPRVRIPFSSLVFVVCCVGGGLCGELITRSQESYRVCVSVCVLEASTIRQPKADLGFCATEEKDTVVYVMLTDRLIMYSMSVWNSGLHSL
jgi:hypothetical protein